MGMGFGLSNGFVDRHRVPAHLIRQLQRLNHMGNLMHAGVVMVMVMVVVMVMIRMIGMPLMVMMVVVVMMVVMVMVEFFLLAMDQHVHMRSGNSLGVGPLRRHGDPGNPQAVEPPQEPCRVRMQLQQRPHQHVSRCAHGAFQIQYFHLHPPI